MVETDLLPCKPAFAYHSACRTGPTDRTLITVNSSYSANKSSCAADIAADLSIAHCTVVRPDHAANKSACATDITSRLTIAYCSIINSDHATNIATISVNTTRDLAPTDQPVIDTHQHTHKSAISVHTTSIQHRILDQCCRTGDSKQTRIYKPRTINIQFADCMPLPVKAAVEERTVSTDRYKT